MAIERRVWVWVGVAAAVVVVAVLAAGSLVNADTYRGRIEAALTQSLGRPVTLGHLDASVLTGSLVANAPSIADDPAFSAAPFLTAKDIKIGVEILPLLLHHELHITGFTVDEPQITLIRAQDGTWNYSSLGSGAKTNAPAANNPLPNLTVGKIEIKDGTLTIGSRPANGAARVYSDVSVSTENFSFIHAFPFTVSATLPGDGSLDVSGTAGPINPKDASLTPLTATITLKHADLAAAGLVDPGGGVGGLADLDAKIVSNGQTAQVSGKLELTQLRLAKNATPSKQAVDAQFALSQDLQAMSGTLTNASVQVGKATLTAAGTYTTSGNVTAMQMKVNGSAMPIDDLEALLPALGVRLPAGSRLQGGTLTMAMDVSGPASAPVIEGPVRVENTQLAGFDLGSKLHSVEALMGAKTGPATTVQVLSANLHDGPDGIRTTNLDAVLTGIGSATGSGTISPEGALNYHLVVKLGGVMGTVATQAVGLLGNPFGAAMGQTANGGIPVTIGGTTSDPTFTPDMSKMAGGVLTKKPSASSLGKALGGLLGR